jgi:LmbE family N-acetylglucosaminyl deacetylase
MTMLVLAAHPDDEVLGCGGTIARLSDAGETVHVVIAAEGATSRDQTRDRGARAGDLSALGEAAREAGRILGARSVELLDLPDNRMDSLDRLDVVKIVEGLVARWAPRTVFTHHAGDVNVDHRRLHEAAVTACRPQPGHSVRRLLFFEVSSSTEWQPPGSAPPFLPNVFVDISASLARKLDALRAYDVEMRPWPHARSVDGVEHLARWRGSTVGVAAAEAFMLGREIV